MLNASNRNGTAAAAESLDQRGRRSESQIDRKPMPRGARSKYADRQEGRAERIEEGYEKRCVPKKEAKRRAWAMVNKDDCGGEEPGGLGRDRATGHPTARKGGRPGAGATAARPAAARSRSARKAAATRKRRGHQDHPRARPGGHADSRENRARGV